MSNREATTWPASPQTGTEQSLEPCLGALPPLPPPLTMVSPHCTPRLTTQSRWRERRGWDEVGLMHHGKAPLAYALGGSESGRDCVHARMTPAAPRASCDHLPPRCVQAPNFLWSAGNQLKPELAEGCLRVGHRASIFLTVGHLESTQGCWDNGCHLWPVWVDPKAEDVGSTVTRVMVQASCPCGPVCPGKVLLRI